MIEAIFQVCDYDLEPSETFENDRAGAEAYAQNLAESTGYTHGVMIRVAVAGSDMPELRAICVFDGDGKQVFRTDAYDPEFVTV